MVYVDIFIAFWSFIRTPKFSCVCEHVYVDMYVQVWHVYVYVQARGWCLMSSVISLYLIFNKHFFSFFPNTVFLLIWEFCIMHPITLPTLPQVHPSTIAPQPNPPQKSPSPIVFPIYSLEHGQTPKGHPLKENRVLPPTPQEVINCEEPHFSIFISVFKNSLNGLLCGLYLCDRILPSLSLSGWAWRHHRKAGSLPVAAGSSTGHRLQRGCATGSQTFVGPETLIQLTPWRKCHSGCKIQHKDSTTCLNKGLIH